MGIHELPKYIRTKTHAYKKVSISTLYLKRVAVDISIYLYKYIRSCGENSWLPKMINLFIALKKNKVIVVCIFDGPNVPPEKLKEREKRSKSRNDTRNKKAEAQRLLDELYSHMDENPSEETPLKLRIEIEELCKRQKNKAKYASMDYRNMSKCKGTLIEIRDKFAKQCIQITQKHADMVKEIATAMGLTVMQADGEAETMCSYLCKKRFVDAVLSEDSDVLAYGTPTFLSKIDPTTNTVEELDLKDLLSQLEMDFAMFRDFCIMCGCDYNERIKIPPKKVGKRASGVGVVKAMKLIKEHGGLDNIEYTTDLDLEPLAYKRCRQLFTLPEMYDDLVLPYSGQIDMLKMDAILKKNRCGFLASSIAEAWKASEIIFEDDDDDISHDIERLRLMRDGDRKPAKTDHRETIKDVLEEEDILESDTEGYSIYADGSCIHNPGPGGWAAMISGGDLSEDKIVCGGDDETTNNRMELKAVIAGLEFLYSRDILMTKIVVYSDSEYVVENYKRVPSWKKINWKDKKNRDLWEALDNLMSEMNVELRWVKGHSGIEGNERVDKIAKAEAKKRI